MNRVSVRPIIGSAMFLALIVFGPQPVRAEEASLSVRAQLSAMAFSPATAQGDYNVVRGGCKIPHTLPRFAVPLDLSNAATISDHELKGRPALLVFFAAPQAASQRILEIAQRAYSRYKREGLAVVGFEVGGQPSYAKPVPHDPIEIRRRFKIGFPIARDCCGAQNLFCVSAVPSLYFVDRSGRMSKTVPAMQRPGSIEHMLKRILKV